jgi:hypothetical protein
MASRKKPQTITLNELTWGEKFQLAFDRQRRQGGMTWQEVSRVMGVAGYGSRSHVTLLKLARRDDAPTNLEQRRMALLAAIAMGLDPAELDLTPEDSGLPGYTVSDVQDRMFPWLSRQVRELV